MRHNKKFNHLTRSASHRRAMLSNMANSLIEHKRIYTTLPKAKALRVYVEPIITRAKDDSVHSRRMVYQKLQNRDAVTELFGTIAEKTADRPGGYTRILKVGKRQGDDAMMCLIELVDFNENRTKEDKKSGSGKRTRRSRRSRSAEATDAAPKAQNTKKEEKPAVEEPTKEELEVETPEVDAPEL